VIDHDAIPERAPSQWALMTTYQSQSPEALEAALREAVDESIPGARDQPGWKGALALASESREHGVVITFWDSVQSLLANARLQLAPLPQGVHRTRDRFEVVHDERPDE
jgi:heme-degrading monooxygenase HmoA